MLPLSAGAGPGTDDRGNQVHSQYEGNQHQGCAVLDLERHFGHLGGDDKQVVGQGHGGVEDGTGQTRQEKAAPVNGMGAVSPAARSKAQDHTGDDAGQGIGQHNAADDLQRVAPNEMETVRKDCDSAQGFLGGGDDDRQGHD